MNEVFLCLGGNIGNREVNLSTAILKIGALCGQVIAKSSIYETDAWGSSSSLKYLNQVIQIRTNLSSQKLLQTLLDIESSLGRQRTENQNADRTIDIDILFFNDEVIESDILNIPHPRLHLRYFVLIPMAEINEGYIHPILNKTIKQLALQCADTLKVNMFIKN
jgi:2-amino-4-hydroxy-6-hydroxymethyldihydropteridine diphosphokinase